VSPDAIVSYEECELCIFTALSMSVADTCRPTNYYYAQISKSQLCATFRLSFFFRCRLHGKQWSFNRSFYWCFIECHCPWIYCAFITLVHMTGVVMCTALNDYVHFSWTSDSTLCYLYVCCIIGLLYCYSILTCLMLLVSFTHVWCRPISSDRCAIDIAFTDSSGQGQTLSYFSYVDILSFVIANVPVTFLSIFHLLIEFT